MLAQLVSEVTPGTSHLRFITVSPPDIHRGVNWLFGGLSKALFSKQLVPIPAVVTAAQSYECVSPGT